MNYEVGAKVFDDWVIVREIGSGASGTVWEIEKREADITISSALKVIHVPQDATMKRILRNDGMDELSITSFFQGVVDDLKEEIKIMVDMKGFPFIVNCEDYKIIKEPDKAEWDILIRMELLTPIQVYLLENSLSEADILRITKELVQALDLFESKGIIHRDIKPDNIFVDGYDHCKIGDFGIARICDKAIAELSKKGTENYMAPEVYHGKKYDQTVDIYSLGLVIYKMLNENRLPFYPREKNYTDWDMQQALIDRLGGKKKIPLPSKASPKFGQIVLKMCEHDPKERYQNAKDILDDLALVNASQDGILLVTNTSAGNKTVSQISQQMDSTQYKVFDSGKSAAGHNRSQVISESKNQEAEPVATAAEKTKDSDKRIKTDTSFTERREKSRTNTNDSQDNRNPASAKKINRKIIIQGIAIAGILFAFLFYFISTRQYQLNVTGGSGTGTLKAGKIVTVKADDNYGSTFVRWDVTGKIPLSEDELQKPEITFKMPRNEVDLKAVYENIVRKVIVNSGSGSGDFEVGKEVEIVAEEAAEGMKFVGWEVEDGSVALEHSDKMKTTFIMPDDDIEVSAVYQALSYNLSVEKGTGSGKYNFGSNVKVVAEEVSGASFKEWQVKSGELKLTEEEKKKSEITFKMPACDVELLGQFAVNQHKITVTGGTGSGNYAVGETVTITAEEPGTGMEFDGWEIENGSIRLEHADKMKTTFVMQDSEGEIAATYKPLSYNLSVEKGTGSGSYDFNSKVKIQAEEISGSTFKRWSVKSGELELTEEQVSAEELSFDMPACDIELTAQYDVNQHKVTVKGGTGSGNYGVGDKVSFTAEEAETGMEFKGWEVEEGNVSIRNPEKEQASITVPDEDVVINAIFEPIEYKVTVNEGNGTGVYTYGEQVKISAKDSMDDIPFSHWTIDKGNLSFADMNVNNILFEMPAEDVVITAHYTVPKFTLTVKNGTGSGKFEAGKKVTIQAEETDKSGHPFVEWKVTKGNLKLKNAKKTTIKFKMPSEKIEIEAVYATEEQSSAKAYSVVVFGGTGAGVYAEGDTVTITASEEPGKKFNCWFISQGKGQSVENDNATFSFSMPAADLIITAMYDIVEGN